MKRFLLGLLLVISCRSEEYFPARTFSDREDWSTESASLYAEQLKALKEAPLFSPKPAREVECYRFAWLRSFDRKVVLRVDVDKTGTGVLTIKISEARPSDAFPKLEKSEKKALTKEQLQSIRALIWRWQFFDEPSHIKDQGVDGATWIIEAAVDGRYHVVSRWSPKTGSVREIGGRLLELAIGGDLMPIY